jgi:hypothetical protein
MEFESECVVYNNEGWCGTHHLYCDALPPMDCESMPPDWKRILSILDAEQGVAL